MALKEYKNIQFPVKVGEDDRVQIYASSLINGEEQILITRTGKIYLTDGKGSYLDLRSNNVFTKEEISHLLQNLDTTLNEATNVKIADLDSDIKIVDTKTNELADLIEAIKNSFNDSIEQNLLVIEENKNSIENNLESFKLETTESILNISEAIETLGLSLNNSNSNIGDIREIIGELSKLPEQIISDNVISAIINVYNQAIIGKSLIAEAINAKMPTLNASEYFSYEELANLIKEIKTNGVGDKTIEDFSKHTSLPSFSNHARLNTFTAGE